VVSTLLNLLLAKKDKLKRSELGAHIEEMERMLLESKVNLDTKVIIANVSGIEPYEHEVDAHEESVYMLESFTNLLRAQMLVTICGYFEYAAKKISMQRKCAMINAKSGLEDIISAISRKNIGLIDSSIENTLNEYRYLRNACTHRNISSEKPDKIIARAEKYLSGIKITHHADSGTGRGKIELDNTFLPKALSVHFDTLEILHKYYAEERA